MALNDNDIWDSVRPEEKNIGRETNFIGQVFSDLTLQNGEKVSSEGQLKGGLLLYFNKM